MPSHQQNSQENSTGNSVGEVDGPSSRDDSRAASDLPSTKAIALLDERLDEPGRARVLECLGRSEGPVTRFDLLQLSAEELAQLLAQYCPEEGPTYG